MFAPLLTNSSPLHLFLLPLLYKRCPWESPSSQIISYVNRSSTSRPLTQ